METVAHQRTLQGAAATIRYDFLDGDGDGASPGTVTVQVDRADGTNVKSAGTATVVPTGRANRRTVALTAAQCASLDRLTCTWTVAGTTVASSLVEIVGGYWLSLDQMRDVPGLANAETEKLVEARTAFEHLAETFMGCAWVPRYERETLRGTDSDIVLLSWPRVRAVSSISVDGTAQTVADWDLDARAGVLRAPTTIAAGADVLVTYTHGRDLPDSALRRAAAVAVRHQMIGDGNALLSPRARAMQTDAGTIDLTYAGRDMPTGLAEVDALLVARRERAPGLA